jgi:hypothetical protein
MIDPSIPEEEMNFDFGLDDILKTTNEASSESTDSENTSNFMEDVQQTIEQHAAEENKPVVEEQVTEQQQPSYNDDVYSAALDVLKENNLLNIPDDIGDINQETWNELIEQNKQNQRDAILNELRMNAADPKITELFDYVYQGGSWHGFEEMKQTINDEINIESLNAQEEDDQRYLIDSYLREGLDPQNPAHQRRIENIPNEVNNYFDRLEAEDIAQEAKNYFLNKVNEQKQIIEYQQQQAKEQELQQQQYQAQQQQEWINNFRQTLNEKNWSQNKKDNVVKQFDIVELDDGREMEMWRYKFNELWKNPNLTQVFIDFISDLDPHTLQFKSRGVPVNKQVTSTIQNLINNKKQNRSKGQYGDKRQVDSSIQRIDPRNI